MSNLTEEQLRKEAQAREALRSNTPVKHAIFKGTRVTMKMGFAKGYYHLSNEKGEYIGMINIFEREFTHVLLEDSFYFLKSELIEVTEAGEKILSRHDKRLMKEAKAAKKK